MLQTAVQKFDGICTTNPPAYGEVKDDAKMDLYYTNIRQIYYERSANVSGLPRKFDEMMQAYHFRRGHPKFMVCFPTNGPPPTVKKISLASKAAPKRQERPDGRDKEKRKSKVNIVTGQVTTLLNEHMKTNESSSDTASCMNKLTDLIARGFDTS
eukprot:scaffold241471_cov36-Cyclotella_meneghiniana.AAC.1